MAFVHHYGLWLSFPRYHCGIRGQKFSSAKLNRYFKVGYIYILNPDVFRAFPFCLPCLGVDGLRYERGRRGSSLLAEAALDLVACTHRERQRQRRLHERLRYIPGV